MNLYLIQRGPKPEYHKAPFHRVIICTSKKVAEFEAGSSADHAWIWLRGSLDNGEGFLIVRWNGLDIDYGPVVFAFKLPDGTGSAFHHPDKNGTPWQLLKGATWWSSRKVPEWLQKKYGVSPPSDEFSQSAICRREQETLRA
jgi:hypothetical protein